MKVEIEAEGIRLTREIEASDGKAAEDAAKAMADAFRNLYSRLLVAKHRACEDAQRILEG